MLKDFFLNLVKRRLKNDPNEQVFYLDDISKESLANFARKSFFVFDLKGYTVIDILLNRKDYKTYALKKRSFVNNTRLYIGKNFLNPKGFTCVINIKFTANKESYATDGNKNFIVKFTRNS